MRRRNRFGAIPVVANPVLRVARGGGPEAGVSLRASGGAIPGLNANEEPLCLRCTGIPLDVTANGSDLYQAGSGDTKPGSRFIAQLRSGTPSVVGENRPGLALLDQIYRQSAQKEDSEVVDRDDRIS